MRTEAGGVAFPLFVAHDDVPADGADRPLRFEVTPAWQDRLIGHYSQILSGHSATRYAPPDALDAIGSLPNDHTRPERSATAAALPMPSSTEALTVARLLLIDPSDSSTVQDWAAHVACGERTLQRQFIGETGLTFAQWRSRRRIAAAAALLAEGSSVGYAAARVGFTDRTSFTRAFREHQGSSPREFSAHAGKHAAEGSTARPQTTRLMHSITDAAQEPLADEALNLALPAERAPHHTHDFHLLSWLYRGTRESTIEGRSHRLARGDALWTPAGQEHGHTAAAGTISFALAMPTPSELQLNQPFSLHFGPHWDDYLLWCAVSVNSLLRPGHDHQQGSLGVFRDQLGQLRTQVVHMPTDPTARALARDFLRTMRITSDDRVPQDVLMAFRRETGMSFQRWRHVARMRLARDLLSEGALATSAARQLGYTHLQSFTNAFRSFHGMSPSQYRQATDEPG
ncbi:MAG: helix-turn-helix domain-containing protein [Tessaracoccus sp.]